jgi:hypothetical protein
MKYEPCVIGRVRFFIGFGWCAVSNVCVRVCGIASKYLESQINPSPLLPIRYISLKIQKSNPNIEEKAEIR